VRTACSWCGQAGVDSLQLMTAGVAAHVTG